EAEASDEAQEIAPTRPVRRPAARILIGSGWEARVVNLEDEISHPEGAESLTHACLVRMHEAPSRLGGTPCPDRTPQACSLTRPDANACRRDRSRMRAIAA